MLLRARGPQHVLGAVGRGLRENPYSTGVYTRSPISSLTTYLGIHSLCAQVEASWPVSISAARPESAEVRIAGGAILSGTKHL